MHKTQKELFKKYKKLPQAEKYIIQTLSLEIHAMKQYQIINCLNSTEFQKNCDCFFSQKNFRTIMLKLVNERLLIKNSAGITTPKSLIRPVIEDLVRNGNLNTIASVLCDEIPVIIDYYSFEDKKNIFKLSLIAVFGDQKHVDIDELLKSINDFECAGIPKTYFLEQFAGSFKSDLFDSVPVLIQKKVFERIISESVKSFEPCDDVADYYYQLLTKNPSLGKEAEVMNLFLLKGRTHDYKKLLELMNKSSHQYATQMGFFKLITDDKQGALPEFNKALKVLKKSKQKTFQTDYDDIFYLFALLDSDKVADHKKAFAYIKGIKKYDPNIYSTYYPLQYLFEEKMNIKPNTTHSLILFREYSDIVNDFFKILIHVWINPDIGVQNIDILKKINNKSVEAGCLWIEAESCALLSRLGQDKKDNLARSQTIHENLGTTTITTIVKSVPKWEKTLSALINFSDNSKNNSDTGKSNIDGQRLVWLMDYSEEYRNCSISPRLQKLSAKGTWTKGRAVALKNLYENYHTLEGLTEQDRRICSTIVEYSYNSGYRYYRQVEYYLDETKVFHELAGHPLIFLEGALETPLELVAGEPEVRIRVKKKGNISISMEPVPGEIPGTPVIIRDAPTRFKYIKFSDDHLTIADHLGEDGLQLPKKAKEMAGKALTSLSSLITVNSDFAAAKSEEVKEITADPLPHVHVMPWQDGIMLDFFVRPFTDAGSYFKPGRGGAHVYAEINEEKLRAIRNHDLEKRLTKDVISKCPSLNLLEEVGGQWLIDTPDDALEVLTELKSCNDGLVMEWPKGEKIKIRTEVSFDDFSMNIKKERNWFKATGYLQIDNDLSLDLSTLMSLLENSSGRFIVMEDGTFVALTNALREKLDDLKAYSSSHGKGVTFPPLAAHAIEDLTEQTGSLKSDKSWKDHCKKIKEVINPQIPGTLQAKLRDYQIDGFNWLARLSNWDVGACLADDMGLGKTVQAIAAILLRAGDGPSLVVAPLSVMANWQDECQKFAPTLTPKFFGAGDRGEFLENLEPFDVVISSYGLLPIESERLALVNWQTIVLDEAQAIKNMKTKRSKAAMDLNAKFRIITTGTPVENHLDELWTLFTFINPGLLGSIKSFKEKFALPIEQNQDKKVSRRLRKLIKPFILRRLKTDVLKELPEKTEITLHVEMSREEAGLYEAQRLKSIENIENSNDKPGQKHLKILAELTKLRQLCCNPSLILPEAGIESSKLKVFGGMVDELLDNGHKALVFSQFVRHLDILRKYLDKKKITYQYLDGSTSMKKRMERIKDFQNGEGDLFLISLKAGGFGLNLTAADYVIHMDPWWNPAVEDQASDRVHRIGQTRPVTVYRLVVKGSIEEQIVKLHEEKRELAESLLEGSDTAGKISADDLLALLHEA